MELDIMTLPTVLFPWVVITVPLETIHSIETGRDNPGIVFISHDKVKLLLRRAELLGMVMVAQLFGTITKNLT